MNLSIIRDQLTEADGHVALGERQIAEQREALARLRQSGQGDAADQVEELLNAIETSQALRIAYRDHLREDLRRAIEAAAGHNAITDGSDTLPLHPLPPGAP